MNSARDSETEREQPAESGPQPGRGPAARADVEQAVPALTAGRDHGTGEPVRLAIESLRKHVAIFAASGSGKTVLLRRLVEECALQGVSAIVLDPNNDLARLGEPWPEPPSGWWPGDADRAARYLAGTELITWTPRRQSGRALSFQPLWQEICRTDPELFD